MSKQTVGFNKSGISQLPDNKPVIYKIQTQGGKTNYTGTAQSGRVQERFAEHLAGARDAVPGTKIQIEQMPSIKGTRARESGVISQSKPKYNKPGK